MLVVPTLAAILLALVGVSGGLYVALSKALRKNLDAKSGLILRSVAMQAEVAKIRLFTYLAFMTFQRYRQRTQGSDAYNEDLELCLRLAKTAHELGEGLRKEYSSLVGNEESIHCVEAANQCVFFHAEAKRANVPKNKKWTPEEEQELVELASLMRHEGRRVTREMLEAGDRTSAVLATYEANLDETYAWVLYQFGPSSRKQEARDLAEAAARVLLDRADDIRKNFGIW